MIVYLTAKFHPCLIRLRPGDFGETRPASPPREDAPGAWTDLKFSEGGRSQRDRLQRWVKAGHCRRGRGPRNGVHRGSN